MDDIGVGIPMQGTHNLNINKTAPDTADNVKRHDGKKPAQHIKADHIIAVILAAFGYIFLWFMSINITNFFCWTKDDFYCSSAEVVHWVFIIGLIAAIVIPTVGGLIYAVQSAKNAEYIELARGISLSRSILDRHAPDLIDVLRISARSEATAGIDTYSPSYTGVRPDKPIISVPEIEPGIAVGNMSRDDVATDMATGLPEEI